MKKARYNKLILWLLHPAVLAIPVSLAVFLLIPFGFQKYSIEPITEINQTPFTTYHYQDMDNDGFSEWITTGKADSTVSHLLVYNKNGIVDQWNIPGFQSDLKEHIISGDADGDGHLEIYPLSVKNDSLFLNAIDIRKKGQFLFYERYITIVKDLKKQSFTVHSGHLTDLNSDGIKEVLLTISVGFTLIPRRIFAIDLKNDTVYQSPELGVSLNKTFYHDLDHDGTDEVLISTVASANTRGSINRMHDHSTYILALNHSLDFYFKPVEFPGDFTFCLNFPYVSEGKSYIGSFIQPFGADNQIIPQVQLRDIKGNLLHKRLIGAQYVGLDCSILPLRQKSGNTRLALIIPEKGISILGDKLEDVNTIKLRTGASRLPYAFDADNDGNDEIITYGKKQGEFYIIRHDLSDKTVFNVDTEIGEVSFQQVLKGEENASFLMQKGNHWYTFMYGPNPSYYWHFLLMLAIYPGLLFFILMIRNLQRVQLQQKYETRQKMAELQLLSLRNQMDPHFTFNVLNTIGSAILQKRNDESYDLLMKFSKLIRTTINSARVICRPLQEELDFVKNYLDLQQIRYEGLFTYMIHLDADITPRQPVPKMILQTYVENSLRHGVVPRKSDGKIQIIVSREEKGIRLMVEDNGVGRQQAKINGSVSTGVGLSIIGQYYALLNRDNEQPITETFTDLYDTEGKAAGTRVEVFIPEGFVFPGVNAGK